MRPLVSYDDISDYQPPVSSPDRGPPSKKHKGSSHVASQQQQRTGDFEQNMTYEDEGGLGGDYEEEESRELTHEEIWDDSALIEAWDAATEEYEVRACRLLNIFNFGLVYESNSEISWS
jgi:hypothetical protein